MDIIGRRRVGLIAAFALLGLTVVAGSTGAFAIGPDRATDKRDPPTPPPPSSQSDQCIQEEAAQIRQENERAPRSNGSIASGRPTR